MKFATLCSKEKFLSFPEKDQIFYKETSPIRLMADLLFIEICDRSQIINIFRWLWENDLVLHYMPSQTITQELE